MNQGQHTMMKETLQRLVAPVFFWLVFLFPSVDVDEAILQVIARHRLHTAEVMKTRTVEQQGVERQH